MKSLIEKCRMQIAQGQTEDAISSLLAEFKKRKTSQYSEILILSSQLSTFNKKVNLGLSYNNEELSRINYSVLKIIDGIENYENLSEGFIQEDNQIGQLGKKYIEDEIDRDRLDFLKNRILETFLQNKIEITKIRAMIGFAYIIFELRLVQGLGLNIFKNKEDVIKNLLFEFNQIDLNVYSVKWQHDLITLYLHHENYKEVI